MDGLGQGLSIDDILPLEWRVLDTPPAPTFQVRLNESNEALLRVIAGFEEHLPEPVDEHGAQAQELARIEFKLNVLLDLVGQLLARQMNLPAPVPFRLHASFLEWRCQDRPPPAAGATVVASLYLNPGYPRPLELLGEVADVEARDGGVWVRMALRGVSEAVQEALEKLIFRHHRRAIAHRRSPRT